MSTKNKIIIIITSLSILACANLKKDNKYTAKGKPEKILSTQQQDINSPDYKYIEYSKEDLEKTFYYLNKLDKNVYIWKENIIVKVVMVLWLYMLIFISKKLN